MEQGYGAPSDSEAAIAEAQGTEPPEPQRTEAFGRPEAEGAQALAEFNDLMAVSGEVIVESPRLPGVPLPLQALMNACPEPVTEENAHKFLAEAHALLAAGRTLEDEEVNEEEAIEEETEPQESKKKLN
ncbi:MAG TPA: hypothetical protein VFJ84_03080 [Candidatus Saccharimonadales bacterium]|nr:hypothetical protein [Candidatus Saccharimonadales bacterium]